MRRREFITLIGGAAAAWPLTARAQQSTLPIVGFLHSGLAEPNKNFVGAFCQGLGDAGNVDGQNVAIEYRWAEGRYERLPALAAELVRRQAAVIVSGSSPAARAANEATDIIPIVFTSGEDPIKAGLVASLNRPGGNITGVYNLLNGLEAKALGLLRDLVPGAKAVAAILDPKLPDAEMQAKSLDDSARTLGLQLHIINAGNALELDKAFATIAQLHAGALLVGADPLFIVLREQIIALAARNALPTIYFVREFAVSGGLMSYGTNLTESYRQTGIYVAQILKGARPADLPVVQSTKFELVINLKTAKALNLSIPPDLLSIADEVIE